MIYSRTFIIIPKKKLVSIDSFAPILLELESRGYKIEAYFFGKALGYDVLVKNLVLRDCLLGVCKVYNVSDSFLAKGLCILKFFVRGLFGARFIHFGFLTEALKGKLASLFSLFSKNIYLAESGSYFMACDKFRRRHSGGAFHDGHRAEIFLALTREAYKENLLRHKKVLFLGAPRTKVVWQNYISKYITEHRAELAFLSRTEVKVFYVMTGFGATNFTRSSNSIEELLHKTLSVFELRWPDVILIIKPHPVTDIRKLGRVLAMYKAKYLITYTHPSILLRYTDLCLSNHFSTVQCDACSMAVPTIEFSDYSEDALSAFSGGSIEPYYIDYFANRSEEDFATVLERALIERKSGRNYCELNTVPIDTLLNVT